MRLFLILNCLNFQVPHYINFLISNRPTMENPQKEREIDERFGEIQRNQIKKTRKIGCWTTQQQNKYIEFLSFFRKQLHSRQKRKHRNNKVFKQMAQFIGSRDGIQCRSHHMKQLRTHKQVRRIISSFTQSKDIWSRQDIDGKFFSQQSFFQHKNLSSPVIIKNTQSIINEEQKTKIPLLQTCSILPIQQINLFQFSSYFEAENYNYYYIILMPPLHIIQTAFIQ